MIRPVPLAALCLALALAAPLAQAQTTPDSRPETEEPGTLERFLDDMLNSVNPWLSELGEMLGDLSGWHAPEFLPNGDILIRRRHEDQSPLPEEAEPGEPFEL